MENYSYLITCPQPTFSARSNLDVRLQISKGNNLDKHPNFERIPFFRTHDISCSISLPPNQIKDFILAPALCNASQRLLNFFFYLHMKNFVFFNEISSTFPRTWTHMNFLMIHNWIINLSNCLYILDHLDANHNDV